MLAALLLPLQHHMTKTNQPELAQCSHPTQFSCQGHELVCQSFDASDHDLHRQIMLQLTQGLKTPAEFWSWILSWDVPTNATCRSTQWEHAFWASISSYSAVTALKLVPAAVSWAIKPLVPLKALLSGANTVTFPSMVLFRSFVNPAASTTMPSWLSCGVAATASNKVVLQVLCMQQVGSIWFQVMIKLS